MSLPDDSKDFEMLSVPARGFRSLVTPSRLRMLEIEQIGAGVGLPATHRPLPKIFPLAWLFLSSQLCIPALFSFNYRFPKTLIWLSHNLRHIPNLFCSNKKFFLVELAWKAIIFQKELKKLFNYRFVASSTMGAQAVVLGGGDSSVWMCLYVSQWLSKLKLNFVFVLCCFGK